MLSYLWLIPLLPAAGALINGVLGKKLPKSVIHTIACGLVFASFLISIWCVIQLAGFPHERRVFEQDYYLWIPAGSATTHTGPHAGSVFNLNIPLGFLLDPLSAVMILVVTG